MAKIARLDVHVLRNPLVSATSLGLGRVETRPSVGLGQARSLMDDLFGSAEDFQGSGTGPALRRFLEGLSGSFF
jgi:hypothetical protein